MAKKTKTETNENIVDLWHQVLDVDKQTEDLKIYRAALIAKLQAQIPENTEINGVRHTFFKKPSVSYAKLLERVRDELVPKTKHASIDILKAQCTSESVQHRITGPKET